MRGGFFQPCTHYSDATTIFSPHGSVMDAGMIGSGRAETDGASVRGGARGAPSFNGQRNYPYIYLQ